MTGPAPKSLARQAVAYYRVSTPRQGRSGLGLEAQQEAVGTYCSAHDFRILSELQEVRSTRLDRPVLYEALELCKRENATLVVARLDRLGRDVEEVSGIIKSNVELVVTDNPHANRLTLHILAAVAQDHRERISENTKAALAAAKRRGVLLGKYGKVLAQRRKREAHEFARRMAPLVGRLNARGFTTLKALSDELNRRGVPTSTGCGKWHTATVHAMLKRIGQQAATDSNNRKH